MNTIIIISSQINTDEYDISIDYFD